MSEATRKMPAGIGNAYAFQVFNTMSFSIVIGTPMLLYLKGLGASGTIIGIAAALPSLLNILQMPAANFVERVGYRAFVLSGWSLRALVVLAVAAVPVLPAALDAPARMGLILFLLFVYNASRGISVCGFLPWVTQLVPEPIRGNYISRDQMCTAVATVGTSLLTAAYLQGEASRRVFGAVFLAGFLAALVSVLFLRRMPDVAPPASEPENGQPVPWKAMALHPPFFRLLVYNVIIFGALGGATVFWVPCLRDVFQLTDTQILLYGAITPLVTALCMPWLGHVADRVGSRPVLGLANGVMALHFASWGALSAGFMPMRWWSILLIQGSAGLGIGALNLGNQRLAMSIVPVAGRSHFLALFSVVNGLTLGLIPIAWGVALDSLGAWRHDWARWQWNHFSLLYALLVVIALAARVWHARLAEPASMTTDEFFQELFLRTPARAITRLLTRRWFW